MKVVPRMRMPYPMSLEREYAKELQSHVSALFAVILEKARNGAPQNAEGVSRFMDDLKLPSYQRAQVERMYRLVSTFSGNQWAAVLRSMFGLLVQPGQRISRQDDAGDDMQRLWIEQNLDLITSIDNETLEKTKAALIRAIQNTVDNAELTKNLIADLMKIEGVEKSRAALIATDQVGKLNGMMTRYQQMQAGIIEFRWTSSHDSRVRPLHAEYDGHIYKWGHPPADGYPGQPIRCRCVAIPVFDLDNIPFRPAKGTYLDAGVLQQPKRRAASVEITDVALDKVERLDVPELSDEENIIIWKEHRELLKTAKEQNGSNEVLSVIWRAGKDKTRVYGDSNHVNIGSSPEASSMLRRAGKGELWYLHNHPSLSYFSMADIITFMRYKAVGILSVVTNQGKVYVLHKNRNYSYNKIKSLFAPIYARYVSGQISHDEAVKEFLKMCKKGGVDYVR